MDSIGGLSSATRIESGTAKGDMLIASRSTAVAASPIRGTRRRPWPNGRAAGPHFRPARIPAMMSASRRALIEQALAGVEAWERRWGDVPEAPALTPDADLPALLDAFAARMDA